MHPRAEAVDNLRRQRGLAVAFAPVADNRAVRALRDQHGGDTRRVRVGDQRFNRLRRAATARKVATCTQRSSGSAQASSREPKSNESGAQAASWGSCASSPL